MEKCSCLFGRDSDSKRGLDLSVDLTESKMKMKKILGFGGALCNDDLSYSPATGNISEWLSSELENDSLLSIPVEFSSSTPAEDDEQTSHEVSPLDASFDSAFDSLSRDSAYDSDSNSPELDFRVRRKISFDGDDTKRTDADVAQTKINSNSLSGQSQQDDAVAETSTTPVFQLDRELESEEIKTPDAGHKRAHEISHVGSFGDVTTSKDTAPILTESRTRDISLCLKTPTSRRQLPSTRESSSNLAVITPETLVQVLRGENEDVPTEAVTVVDCRYPYEHAGGHIRGAENLYSRQQITERFIRDGKSTDDTCTPNMQVIVFHCEFSQERGPKLLRFLREQDRSVNEYPSLHYPDIYLLAGGYKKFWDYVNELDHVDELCEPIGYTPMLESAHAQELASFRKMARTPRKIRPVGITRPTGRARAKIF